MADLVPFRRKSGLPEMFREMEDFVNRFWRLSPFEKFSPFEETEGVMDVGWQPTLDLSETDDDVIVKAELPGLEAKDLDISLERDLLVLKGEKKQEKEEKNKRFHRIERTYGAFHRAIRLPVEVKTDKIDATFKDGVLTVTLPKAEDAKKQITHIKIH